jgi:hypothetical protein
MRYLIFESFIMIYRKHNYQTIVDIQSLLREVVHLSCQLRKDKNMRIFMLVLFYFVFLLAFYAPPKDLYLENKCHGEYCSCRRFKPGTFG